MKFEIFPGVLMWLARLYLPLLTLSLALDTMLFAHPGSGIVVDEQGRVFFTYGASIVMVETNGVGRTIVQDKANEKFYQLHQIERAPDGGMLTASDLGNAIWRFSAEGEMVRFYPPPEQGRALAVGTGGDPFTVDREGNVYAVNSSQYRFCQIILVSPEGRIRELAGGEWGYADGKGSAAKFGDLHGGSMVFRPDGTLLVTENLSRVRAIAPDGTVTTLAGGEKQGYRNGPGVDAQFERLRGLAIDAEGNVIVVEEAGRIRKIARDGWVTTVAGSQKEGSIDGPALQSSFDEPTGIAIGKSGELLILEPSGPRVRKIFEGRAVTIYNGSR